MQKKWKVLSMVTLLLVVVVSSGTIACSTAHGVYGATPSVELRNVRQFETTFTARVNEFIRTNPSDRFAASETDWFNKKLWRDVMDETIHHTKTTKALDLDVVQLAAVRALVQERADEAFASGGNAPVQDLLTASLERDFVATRIAPPRRSAVLSCQ